MDIQLTLSISASISPAVKKYTFPKYAAVRKTENHRTPILARKFSLFRNPKYSFRLQFRNQGLKKDFQNFGRQLPQALE